jgi:two-component system, OmpR family, response regulator AdeR
MIAFASLAANSIFGHAGPVKKATGDTRLSNDHVANCNRVENNLGHPMDSALILIVEDEPHISEVLEAYFQREGFRTVTARDGDIAIQHHHMLKPDLIVLDVNLPKLNGYEVLSHVRRESQTPVIMATALGEDLDRLTGLKVGADDYVVKPYNPVEVVARAQAVLRRTRGGFDAHRLFRAGALEVDTSTHTVSVIDKDKPPVRVEVTLTEFRILSYLARAPRQVFTRSELADACLPSDGDALERTVDSHCSKLRRKLEAAGAVGFLQAVRGVGYRLTMA